MTRALRRERARADRTGLEFALLTFAASEPEEKYATLASVARVLGRRLRVTDEYGWLDADRIGVVLPATASSGAWKVADDVVAMMPRRRKPVCRVYMYPSRPSDGGRHQTSEERLVPIEPACRPVGAMESFFVEPLPRSKRAVDVVLASALLLALLPLLLVVALAVKWTSPGPIFFRQRRSGLGGRPFWMLKFRSMIDGAELKRASLLAQNEQDGPAFKIRRDPRITPLGSVIRATSIDELPQLWNVLRGEMSLVGPRPLPVAEQAGCLPWQQQRLDVTPGLTCIWQIQGRSRVTFSEWVRMDVRYIRSRSLWSDLGLLAATLPAMVLRRGV